MAVIDDKVVSMSFESSKFETGVNSTLTALDKLKSALKFPEAGKGLDDVGKAAARMNLSRIGDSIDTIKDKLGAFHVAAVAIFASIAMKAVQAGSQVVKSFTLEPLIAGYKEYATNLNAVQTILANTQASGATLKDVNAALLDLNKYSDKTIYNFSQMAKNIGTFTAAGVDLQTATGAIKGIANLAALSGSNAEQASTAMYQLSQAIAAGRVSLMDWNSVVNAGMGGTVFQRALAQTAVAMGKIDEGAVKLTGKMKNVTIAGKSFRESISSTGKGGKSWLTSDVLTNTLKQFTGDLSKAELKAQGFNDAQIKAIQATAMTAQHAATEVKTLSQVIDVAKETAGSGWAQTWQIIFGNFGEAKTTFTALSNTINGFINANARARNRVLADWKALGGRTVLIDAIKTAFHNLGEVIAPIKEAFRDIFPATTGRDLFNLTLGFKNFAEALKPSPQTVENLRRTFAGLFAIFDIGKQIIGGIFTVFKKMIGVVGAGNGGFLSFTAAIGDFFVALDKSLKKGDRLNEFFSNLGDILAKPLQLLQKLASVLGSVFSGFSSAGISAELTGMNISLTPLQKLINGIATAWDNLINSFKNAGVGEKAVDGIVKMITGLGEAIGNAAANMNFEAILAVIRTGLFGALVLMFKNFLGKGSFAEQLGGLGGGIIKNIAGTFGALEGSMKAMQQNLKAKTLKEIAIAIALLAASVVALSFVKPERLNAALGAMTIMFGELIGAMALLDKATKGPGFLKLPVVAAALIGFAIALDILTISVMAMSRLSWNDLTKGLTGVGALLIGVSAAARVLSANSVGLVSAGVGITALAIAMKILASAVADFAVLSWTEIAKGLVGVGGGLAIISASVRTMPKGGMITAGIALIAIATGLKILASAVMQFSNMDWKALGRGLAGVAGSLVIIAATTRVMPGASLIATGAGLILVALALNKIADAVAKMGAMSITQIAKGLAVMGGALIELAVGLNAMSGTLAGAAALSLAAVGIAMLAPALVLLGKQSWGSILKSMVALGAALAIIGVAGAAVGPAVPALIGLGVAVALIGGGLALAGAGMFLFAAGLSALAVAAPTGVGVLIAAFNQFLEAIPEFAKNLAIGALQIVEAFAKTAPAFVAAMVKIINSLLDVVIQSSPKIGEAFTALLLTALKVIDENKEKVIAAGFGLLIALLQGIKENIAQVTTMAIDIIVTFLQTLAANASRLIAAGVTFLVSLLKGIASGVGRITAAAIDIVVKFIAAIASNLPKVLTAGVSILTNLITGISKNIVKIVAAGGDAIIKFIEGVGKKAGQVVAAGVDTMIKFINGLGQNSVRLANAAGQAIVDFLNGLRVAVNTYAPQIRTASLGLGYAIIDGMTGGMLSKAGELYDKARGIAKKALGIIGGVFGWGSPATEMIQMGSDIVGGMVIGIDKNARNAYSSALAMSNGLIRVFTDTFQTNSPSKVMMQIGQYVGQGFALGLRGSQDDIRSVFTELNNKLTEAMASARETIITEEKRLEELRKAKKPDADAIKKVQETIAQNELLLRQTTAAHRALVIQLKDEKGELMGLSKQYDAITTRLKAAQDILKTAKQDYADTVSMYKSQYSDLPDIQMTDANGEPLDPAQQLATYLEAIKNQSTAVAAYNSTLQQLRKLGLDDATYQKLLQEGPADQAFANQLLAGGKTAVTALNKLDAQLMTVSKTLAVNAAKNLKQAGIDAAEGLVQGLRSKRSAIRKEIEEIANEMVQTLRTKLKSKSPSEVFADIGGDAMKGMALGFKNSRGIVRSAIEDAAKDALTSMKASIRGMSDIVSSELNPRPVISPILDLTQVRSQSGELAALTNVSPIKAAASYVQASAISTSQHAASDEMAKELTAGTVVKFEQNNYSPEALSQIDIYRQTRNQLSQLKSVLA